MPHEFLTTLILVTVLDHRTPVQCCNSILASVNHVSMRLLGALCMSSNKCQCQCCGGARPHYLTMIYYANT